MFVKPLVAGNMMYMNLSVQNTHLSSIKEHLWKVKQIKSFVHSTPCAHISHHGIGV